MVVPAIPLNDVLKPVNEGVVLVATSVPPAAPDQSWYCVISAAPAVPDWVKVRLLKFVVNGGKPDATRVNA